MFTGSIKISELDALSAVVAADFFPTVQSGSLTTFRVNISTLNNWFRISGSCISSSWASSSLNALASVSSSWASASISSSFAISASKAVSSSYATTSSYALLALTASLSLTSISASFAPFTQSVQTSGSWASQSLSSSYAVSASYAPVNGDTLPIGTIISFGSSTIPANYLECNGDAKSTASFADLYSIIQNSDPSSSYGYLCDSFGNRNSSGTFFKLPDLRGEFLRGWDHSRGIDSSRIFGTLQTASLGTHYHGMGAFTAPTNDDVNIILRSWNDGNNYTARLVTGNSGGNPTTTLNNPSDAIGTTGPINVGDARPRNIAIIYCIKYSNTTNFASSGATLAGDVIGLTSATNVVAIQGIPITSSAPVNGQILQFNSGSGKWVPTSPTQNGLVAWATILIPTASIYSSNNPAVVTNGNLVNKPQVVNGFNVSDVSWCAQTVAVDSNFLNGRPFSRTIADNGRNLLVTLSTPASSSNFMVMGSCFEQVTEYGSVAFYPFQSRTTSQFTMSFGGQMDYSGGNEFLLIAFQVYV